MTLAMFDAINVPSIPPSAPAVAGYVDGAWPTAALLLARFPHAHILTIAVIAAHDAHCLDIETGDASPEDAAAWYLRQRARGITRPALYASASVMEASVVPAIRAAGIIRSSVRLWSAHYTDEPHICGPASCGAMSIEADGTQWTSTAMGRDLDQSLLLDDFFGTPPAPKPKPAPQEDDMVYLSPLQLPAWQSGPGSSTPAVTVDLSSAGTHKAIGFSSDYTLAGQPRPSIRVAVHSVRKGFSQVVHDQAIPSGGKWVLEFAEPDVDYISVARANASPALVSAGT